MASQNAVEIATGHWYDYNKSGWGQGTYTVAASNGVLILTALSTFVAVVASSFWGILAFALHQWKTSPRPHDGLHEQHLIILRNTSNPLSAIWFLLCTIPPWSGRQTLWQKRKPDPYAHNVVRRTILMILSPLICWIAFVVIGIFSARVASHTYSASSMRVKGTNCGFAYSVGTSLASVVAYDQYIIGHTTNALNYASNCYGASSILACNFYPTQALSYSSSLVSGCPFGNRCITETFRLDSAWLDSHEDFGINAPLGDRIQVRKTSECAVVNVTDRVQITKMPDTNLYAHYYYLGELVDDGEVLLNYTAAVLTEEPLDYVLYNIRPYTALIGLQSGWQPIPDFTFENGDVSLFFITSGNLVYTSPVNDPLFSATAIPFDIDGEPVYKADSLAGVMACVEYFQIQNPQGTIQTLTAAAKQVFEQALTLDFNVAQLATVYRFQLLFQCEMYTAVNGLGVAALNAQKSLVGEISIGLPSNQWQIEVMGWFETNLAFMQAIVEDYVLKNDNNNNQSIHPIADSSNQHSEEIIKALRGQCSQQIIHGITGYQSFSSLGIWVIVCTGLFFIFVNLILAVSVGSFQRWASRGHPFGRQQHQRQRWIMDSMFHLQRIAHQFINRSVWDNSDGFVPVTRNHLKPLNSVAQVTNDVPLLTPERNANDAIPTGEAI